MSVKAEALKELAKRELEKRHEKERSSLTAFISYYFKEEFNREFQLNWHHQEIAEALEKVLKGEITRLIINMPPGAGKTELVTKCFPVWALGVNPETQIIATGYSATLTQNYGSQARDYYRSETFLSVFPRRPDIRQDQDTKGLWKLEKTGGQYLAAGTAGAITGNRANIFIIDDPIKPDEADKSDVKRYSVNSWYDNTVLSRLYNPIKDAVIIVMQRTHEDDLCGYLLAKELEGKGEKWEHIEIKAIAEQDEKHRQKGESYHEERMPLEALEKMKLNDSVVFSTQYQQSPTNKDSQEFHEEFFRYYDVDDLPKGLRVYTIIDPAFKKKEHNDETAIITGGFIDDKLYILEITHGRLDASEVISKVIYHAKKWAPVKIGIEGYQAQTVMAQWLKKRLIEEKIGILVDEVVQKGDKEAKIRGLQAPIRQGKIYWQNTEMALESQLKKFPRGKHDDIIDALQMLYQYYGQIQPERKDDYEMVNLEYDQYGRPILP